MITIPGVSPIFMWLGFLALVAVFLILDLGVFNKKKHTLSIKEALFWSAVWFSMSMLFNLFLWFEFGSKPAVQFLAGYILEKSLSVDNLFVILLIFLSFKIEPKYQHKILFWGIVGALLMRGLMIGIGAVLITKFHWILYLFGLFLIYGGINIIRKKEETYDPHDSLVVRMIRKIVHVTRDHHDGALIVRRNGKTMVTLFFVVLVVIEVTDLAFALDSIPAIFGITTDPYIVFTSNIFAILGLRSLYFVILKAHDYFHYLNYGLGIILMFIGVKMLVEDFIHISIFLSLGIIIGILALAMIASVTWVKHHPHHQHPKLKK